MRGLRRLSSYYSKARLLLGEMCHLDNWQHLRQMAAQAEHGKEIHEAPVLHFRNGLRINMVPNSHVGWDFLFEEIFLSKCYQPTPDFVPQRGWTVVDLGGNMGFFTCQASMAAPDVRVISVEPLRPYQEILKKNIEDNKFAGAMLIEGAICGEPDQTIPLTIWYTSSGELKTGMVPDTAARVETINARGFTLPEVFDLGKVEQCDLLKVDIEGAEYDLFDKIPASLWKRISRVVMEVHRDESHSEKQIVPILERSGFRVQLKHESSDTPLLWAIR